MAKRLFIPLLIIGTFFGVYACSTSKPKKQSNKILTEIIGDLSKKMDELDKTPQLLNKHSFYRTVEYPEQCRKAGAEGTVYVSFTVTKTGNTKNFEVEQGIGHGCDRATVRHIRMYAEFSPAMKNGKPVSTKFTLPITYQIR